MKRWAIITVTLYALLLLLLTLPMLVLGWMRWGSISLRWPIWTRVSSTLVSHPPWVAP